MICFLNCVGLFSGFVWQFTALIAALFYILSAYVGLCFLAYFKSLLCRQIALLLLYISALAVYVLLILTAAAFRLYGTTLS